MNAVDPEIDVAFGREVALAPARVLFRPSLLETPYGRGRKPAGVLAKQRNERLLEVAGGDPLEVSNTGFAPQRVKRTPPNARSGVVSRPLPPPGKLIIFAVVFARPS